MVFAPAHLRINEFTNGRIYEWMGLCRPLSLSKGAAFGKLRLRGLIFIRRCRPGGDGLAPLNFCAGKYSVLPGNGRILILVDGEAHQNVGVKLAVNQVLSGDNPFRLKAQFLIQAERLLIVLVHPQVDFPDHAGGFGPLNHPFQ